MFEKNFLVFSISKTTVFIERLTEYSILTDNVDHNKPNINANINQNTLQPYTQYCFCIDEQLLFLQQQQQFILTV